MTKIIMLENLGCDFAFDRWAEMNKFDENPAFALLGNNRLIECKGKQSSQLYQVIFHIEKWGCYSFETVMEDIQFTPTTYKTRTALFNLFNSNYNGYKSFSRSGKSDCELAAEIMSFITGETWNETTITGSSQSDWQGLVYNVSVLDNIDIEMLQAAYFGECYEVGIIENDNTDVDISNVDYWDYVPYLKTEKSEICFVLGLEPEKTTIYKQEEVSTVTYKYIEM